MLRSIDYWRDTFWQDLRYGSRVLRRTPFFGLTAALSLAIGIGATTAIFSVGDALLFRAPAGVADADRLVDIGTASDGFRLGTTSYPTYLAIRERAATLADGVYAYSLFPSPMSLAGAENAERVYGHVVTANFFSVLGTRAAAGRLFDDRDSGAVVVLSHRFWTRRFNGEASVVGRAATLNGTPFTIVGVAAAGFQGTTIRSPDLWIPLAERDAAAGQRRVPESLLMGGRLRPGISLGQADAELDTISRALEREHPEQNRNRRIAAAALSPSPDMRGPLAAFLTLLIAIGSIVLTVACTNVAGVLLARAASRRREIAMRLAIGAPRARLVRQLLVETLLLFAVGGAAGVLLAQWITVVLARLLPALPFPIDVSFGLDRRAFAFSAGLSFAAALVAGLAPALQGSKVDLLSVMRDDRRGIRRMRLRSGFVVVQVALSIVLVAVAGLFVRALEHVASSDPGLDPRGVELADLNLSLAGYDDTTGPMFARALVERLRGLPGVDAASLAFVPPGSFDGLGLGIWPAGHVSSGDQRSFGAGNIVEPGYFRTLRIAIVAGRDFSDADRKGTQPVAIVSEATARRFWPDRAAVGQYLVRATGTSPNGTETLLVVGVARSVSYNSLVDGTRELYVYLPLQQSYLPSTTIIARAVDGRRLRTSIAELVRSMNARLPIVSAESLEDRIAVSRTPQRIAASLSGILGLVGLLLSTIGIYGVTAYTVATRTREIGIRLALGARSADVARMVLGNGMSLVAIGGVIGLMIAAAVSQTIASLLFGLPSLDPVSFGITALLFTGAGLAACYVPLRRATAVSVTDALRYE